MVTLHACCDLQNITAENMEEQIGAELLVKLLEVDEVSRASH